MKKLTITMPKGVRYMSEASQILQTQLPKNGKYILDKSLTGCGGTEFFLNSGRPLVLVSPRTGVLLNKSLQHPECHLFRDTSKTDPQTLKANLRQYLDRPVNIWSPSNPPVILVTLDSAKYVIEELRYRRTIDQYIFLVDEFHCLIGDAAFKGDVDLEFLKMLDSEAKHICFLSATPIDDTYLSVLPEFQGVDLYKLQWDPDVVVEPTVKEIMIGAGESAASIMKNVIADYRRNGCFARKILDGATFESKEAVVFVNEVRTILQIIKENNLRPHEVTILVSSSNKYVRELKKLGFQMDAPSVDKTNPRNTTFTFCSKASFEGRDFYSTSAFTYIFIDGSKDWEIHDTTIEIPQMLGRQRLDANPFKYNAIIYYRTKPNIMDLTEYMKLIGDKLRASQTLLDSYIAGDQNLKQSLAGLVKDKDPNNRYQNNYLDIVNDAAGAYTLAINYLVAASEHNLDVNKTQFYNNPLYLTTAIHDQMATSNTKPQELRNFETAFNSAKTFREKLRLYCTFMASYPNLEQALLENPFIELYYHHCYHSLGPTEIALLDYDEAKIESAHRHKTITALCRQRFIKGRNYTSAEAKTLLQEIYDIVGMTKRATASDLQRYIPVHKKQITLPGGSRQWVFSVE